MSKTKIAIIAVNHNIPKEISDRFIWSAKNSEREIPFDLFLGSHEDHMESFRKTTILNDILRKIIDSYNVIIQTDIDMLIPPSIIKRTVECVRGNSNCYHCNFRYVEAKEVDGWNKTGYNTIPWVNIQHRKLFCASGSWNGMSNLTWKRSNGFCEAIFYLGGPDTEFYRRSMKRGILWNQENELPLSHINHKKRSIPKQGKKNLSIAKRYPIDYNWLYRRCDGVSPTKILDIGVNHK
jgi:hypothetical protein